MFNQFQSRNQPMPDEDVEDYYNPNNQSQNSGGLSMSSFANLRKTALEESKVTIKPQLSPFNQPMQTNFTDLGAALPVPKFLQNKKKDDE